MFNFKYFQSTELNMFIQVYNFIFTNQFLSLHIFDGLEFVLKALSVFLVTIDLFRHFGIFLHQ